MVGGRVAPSKKFRLVNHMHMNRYNYLQNILSCPRLIDFFWGVCIFISLNRHSSVNWSHRPVLTFIFLQPGMEESNQVMPLFLGSFQPGVFGGSFWVTTRRGWWNGSKDGSESVFFFEKGEVLDEWPCSSTKMSKCIILRWFRGFHHFSWTPSFSGSNHRSSGVYFRQPVWDRIWPYLRSQVWFAWRAGDRLLASIQVMLGTDFEPENHGIYNIVQYHLASWCFFWAKGWEPQKILVPGEFLLSGDMTLGCP